MMRYRIYAIALLLVAFSWGCATTSNTSSSATDTRDIRSRAELDGRDFAQSAAGLRDAVGVDGDPRGVSTGPRRASLYSFRQNSHGWLRGEKDPKKAAEYFARGCEQRSPGGVRDAGLDVRRRARRRARSDSAHTNSTPMHARPGAGLGCVGLGLMYEQELVVDRDASTRFRSFDARAPSASSTVAGASATHFA